MNIQKKQDAKKNNKKEPNVNIERHIHFTNQVYQGNVEEVQNGRLCTRNTPMVTSCKLSKDDESPKENQTLYRSMIGNLLYVTASRSNIMQAVGLVAPFKLHQKKLMCKQ
jgi:hypothetical protein